MEYSHHPALGEGWPDADKGGMGNMSRFQGPAPEPRAGRGRRWLGRIVVGVTGVAAVVLGATLLGAPSPFPTGQSEAAVPVPAGMAALNTVPVPLPTGIGTYVVNNAAAIQLGKALFWDMHAGSDNVTACASCHFSAGTDRRDTNTLNPGVSGAFIANQTVTAANFPMASGQVVGSQGVIPSTFNGIDPTGQELDTPSAPGAAPGIAAPGNKFVSNGANVRRVTGRNTPSVINAVFNHRNFWDGRAQNHFNGVNPFGDRDPNAKVLFFDGATPSLVSTLGTLDNASLASQAVGPPGNNVEMSADGRTLRDIGKKLLAAGNLPLSDQAVSPTDSVLGGLRAASGKGLSTSYMSMIESAFSPAWWNSPNAFDQNGVALVTPPVQPNDILPDQGGLHVYTQMQYNFGLFWGLAINLYEATLVSDQTPFDLYAAGDRNALSAQEQAGMTMFASKITECNGCHTGAEFSGASVTNVNAIGLIENDG